MVPKDSFEKLFIDEGEALVHSGFRQPQDAAPTEEFLEFHRRKDARSGPAMTSAYDDAANLGIEVEEFLEG